MSNQSAKCSICGATTWSWLCQKCNKVALIFGWKDLNHYSYALIPTKFQTLVIKLIRRFF